MFADNRTNKFYYPKASLAEVVIIVMATNQNAIVNPDLIFAMQVATGHQVAALRAV